MRFRGVLDRLEVVANLREQSCREIFASASGHRVDVGDRRLLAVARDHLERGERRPVLVPDVANAAVRALEASYTARWFLAALGADTWHGARITEVDGQVFGNVAQR